MQTKMMTVFLLAGIVGVVVPARVVNSQARPSEQPSGDESAPCEGAQVQNAHSHSRCIDGYWHVVTVAEYLCGDGTRKTASTTEKTDKSCSRAKEGEVRPHSFHAHGEGTDGESGTAGQRKANDCTRQHKNEDNATWFRCVKGETDTCAKSCNLWKAKKSDNSDEQKVGDPGEWVKAIDNRLYKYYCRCE